MPRGKQFQRLANGERRVSEVSSKLAGAPASQQSRWMFCFSSPSVSASSEGVADGSVRIGVGLSCSQHSDDFVVRTKGRFQPATNHKSLHFFP